MVRSAVLAVVGIGLLSFAAAPWRPSSARPSRARKRYREELYRDLGFERGKGE